MASSSEFEKKKKQQQKQTPNFPKVILSHHRNHLSIAKYQKDTGELGFGISKGFCLIIHTANSAKGIISSLFPQFV